MDNINIYTYTDIRGPRRRDGAFAYVLEMLTDKGAATLTNVKEIGNATENRAELTAIWKAVERLKRPCTLSIYTNSSYAVAAFKNKWVDKWRENSWFNAKGDPVANAEEWKNLLDLLDEHEFQFFLKEPHSYMEWMKMEVEKKRRK